MLELLGWFGVFALSLLVLIRASDEFTDCAEVVGRFFGLGSFAIGVVIVGAGTSIPELMSSVLAVLQGSPELVVGNVVGSNVANIFLILGAAAILGRKIVLDYEIASVDMPLFLGTNLLMALMIADRTFSNGEAILSIVAYVIYLLYNVGQGNDTEAIPHSTSRLDRLPKRALLVLVVSAALIFVGADYTVRSVVNISQILDISPEMIAVSALALGTSLPELTVSIISARKGKPEVAVGNVIGSNVFNALVVMAIPRLFGALVISKQAIEDGLLQMVAGTLLLCIVVQDKQITRWEGCLFIVFYVWFIGDVFGVL